MEYLIKHKQPLNFSFAGFNAIRLILVLLIWSISISLCYGASRGIMVKAKTASGETRTIPLYSSGYYALVIGAGDYENGWPDLRNAVSDAETVAKKFKGLGWEVRLLKNPDSDHLADALNRIIVDQGKVKDKGVLIWFSGHGHTLKEADGSNLGYIVPVDAPLPTENEFQFMRKAIDMRRIETIARRIQSKHMLLVFDSCFSGSIFNINRAAPSPYIQEKVAEPVRQIITAGDENEQVPDKSVFKTVFLQGVFEGYADRNIDGFVTGEELGAYLAENVINYSRGAQHPQYGKINHPKLDKGDFVFRLASSGAQIDAPALKPSKTSLSVSSNISGASVYIDNRHVGNSPIQNKTISSGSHKVKVSKTEYEPYETSINIRTGRHVALDVYLEKEAPAVGNLYVNSRPSDATIRILNIGPKYTRGMVLLPDQYHVEVSKDGYETNTQWITVSAGEDKYVTVVLANPHVAEAFMPSSKTRPSSGSTFTDPVTGMAFVWIPAGCFWMGQTEAEKDKLVKQLGKEDYDKYCADEGPRHRVCVGGFWLAKTEVTRGQFRKFITATGYHTDAEKEGWSYGVVDGKWGKKEGSDWKNAGFSQTDDHPVVNVSWNDAKAFSEWLSKQTGKTLRLPTEAEWEYACRAGTTTSFAFGNCLSTDQANYNGNYPFTGCSKGEYIKKTIPVGSLVKNAWGLYDMHGNVFEWCSDWYGAYSSKSVTDPSGPTSGKYRVLRGGSWFISAWHCRSADRYRNFPGIRSDRFGFRLVRLPGQ